MILRLQDIVANGAIGAAAAFVLVAAGCVYKPVPVVVIDHSTGAPIAEARVGSDAVHLFSILPDAWNPALTDVDGHTLLELRSKRSLVAILRDGYEPMTFVVVPGGTAPRERPPLALEGSKPIERSEVAGAVVDFDALSERAQLLIPLTLCRREAISMQVVDAHGDPVPGAEVLASSFLYLPAFGLEPEWGRLPLEVCHTDESGHATIHWTSGFENRACVRAPGRQSLCLRVDDPRREGATAAERVTLDQLVSRRVRFRVVEPPKAKGTPGTPISGAVLAAGEARDGLPPDPNAFSITTDAQGLTPEVLLPGPAPLMIRVSKEGYGVAQLSPTVLTYTDGDTIDVWLPKGKAGLGGMVRGVRRATKGGRQSVGVTVGIGGGA